MDLPGAIRALTEHKNLSAAEMEQVMRTIMTGNATPAQIGGFLIGLRMKGETVSEIAAAAKVMRELAAKVKVSGPNLVDTCGTGGDGANTFNISTASAFVVAGAGGRVAKHGNRSITSKSGSADVLEAAGVNLDLSPEQVALCVNEVGLGFMFAPRHHGAMKHAIGPRKEMAARTIFNVLGPLTNPAGAPNQVLGVFSEALVEPLANVLKQLGSEHVLVVNAQDGLDEISIAANTNVAELNNGVIRCYQISPEQFGMQKSVLSTLAVDSAEASLQLIQRVFAGEKGAPRDIVALNAGAAIYAAGLVDSLESGVSQALSVIDNGLAQQKLEALVAFTNTLPSA